MRQDFVGQLQSCDAIVDLDSWATLPVNQGDQSIDLIPRILTLRAFVHVTQEFGKGYGVAGDRFGYEVVKRLVELAYGERLGDERREVTMRAQRELDAHLLEISEAMY